MGFGYICKELEIDLSGSPSNEAEFVLAVTQEDGPIDTGAEIQFEAAFESHLGVSITKSLIISRKCKIYTNQPVLSVCMYLKQQYKRMKESIELQTENSYHYYYAIVAK